jgi:hypothetical protein
LGFSWQALIVEPRIQRHFGDGLPGLGGIDDKTFAYQRMSSGITRDLQCKSFPVS